MCPRPADLRVEDKRGPGSALQVQLLLREGGARHVFYVTIYSESATTVLAAFDFMSYLARAQGSSKQYLGMAGESSVPSGLWLVQRASMCVNAIEHGGQRLLLKCQ